MSVTLDDVEEWLDEEYNRFVSTYQQQDSRGEYVRLTDGSAGHYVDIFIRDNAFKLEGERPGGEVVNATCEATRDALLSTLLHGAF